MNVGDRVQVCEPASRCYRRVGVMKATSLGHGVIVKFRGEQAMWFHRDELVAAQPTKARR